MNQYIRWFSEIGLADIPSVGFSIGSNDLKQFILGVDCDSEIVAPIFDERAMEVLVRPRLGFVPDHVIFSRIAGVLIAASGAMLMLPFPLPFSNSLPAWTVVLLSAGALGRDGLFFFAGCAMFLVSLGFLCPRRLWRRGSV